MKNNEISEKEKKYSDIKKAYYKEWRKNNKDKVKKHNETFWKKQAEKLKQKEN